MTKGGKKQIVGKLYKVEVYIATDNNIKIDNEMVKSAICGSVGELLTIEIATKDIYEY